MPILIALGFAVAGALFLAVAFYREDRTGRVRDLCIAVALGLIAAIGLALRAG